LAVRPLVVDVAEEGQHIGLQPTNVGGLAVTTGPAIVPIAPLGGTYWVDNTAAAGGDGSDELPFSTIAAGLARIAVQAVPVGTLLIAGRPDYTSEGLIACPDAITARIFAWGAPSQQPVSFSLTAGTGSPLIYLRGCNVELTLGQAIVQTDMTSIVAVSNVGGSTLVMRGGSARLSGQVCRLSGTWDDAACSLMHVGAGEAELDCVSLRCDACTVEGSTLVAGSLEFRTTSFSTAIGLDATTITMDRQSERSAALAGATVTSLPVPLEPTNPIYGNGDAGDVVQAASAVLSLSAEYNNLTFAAGGQLRLETTPLRVRNLLSLVAADASALLDYLGGAGGNAAGGVGGASWGGTGGATQGTTGTRQTDAGANGVTVGAGLQPAGTGLQNSTFGGTGGAGGAGGAGGGGAGGAGKAAAPVTNERVAVHWRPEFIGPSSVTGNTPIAVFAAQPGQAGSSGGSGGTGELSGGGGGAGRGGGPVLVYARGIELGPTGSPASVIDARGQPGGNGAPGTGGDAGGGGGGAGGGGGLALVAYDWIVGPPPAVDEINASGGAGGNGAAGGVGGSGGDGGNGGQIVLWNLLTNTRKVVTGAAGAAGTAGTPGVGGVGGAGGACTTDLP
jgi:hypothetical protein